MNDRLKKKAFEAFKKRYGELPADAGFPVVRVKHDGVYFARTLEEWHEYAKAQRFLEKLMIVIMAAVVSIVAFVFVDLFYVSNHQLLLVLLAGYCIALILFVFVVSCHRPKGILTDKTKEIIFYDEYKDKIYVIVL